MKRKTANTILSKLIFTGIDILSGFVGLKLRLKIPQRQTEDLCEHVDSWNARAYPAPITTPEAFQFTVEISIFSSPSLSKNSRV
jgi:hypothetical protein